MAVIGPPSVRPGIQPPDMRTAGSPTHGLASVPAPPYDTPLPALTIEIGDRGGDCDNFGAAQGYEGGARGDRYRRLCSRARPTARGPRVRTWRSANSPQPPPRYRPSSSPRACAATRWSRRRPRAVEHRQRHLRARRRHRLAHPPPTPDPRRNSRCGQRPAPAAGPVEESAPATSFIVRAEQERGTAPPTTAMTHIAIHEGRGQGRRLAGARHRPGVDALMPVAAQTVPPRAQPLKGILLVVLATLAFALADVVTKQQTMRHPVSVVVAVRYLVNLGLLTLFLGPRLGSGLWRTDRRWLVFVRGLCLALASLTMGLALRLMPVGETVAIVYLSPFAVMLLAIPLLGERVGAAGWTGAAVGFLGVLLIVRPGGGLDPLGVAFALVNAGFATAYHLLTRHLAGSESTDRHGLPDRSGGQRLLLPDGPGLARRSRGRRRRPCHDGPAGRVVDARPFPLHRRLPRGARLAARPGQLPAPLLGRWLRLADFRPPSRWLGPCGHGADLRIGHARRRLGLCG